jgi:hypothetical protein
VRRIGEPGAEVRRTIAPVELCVRESSGLPRAAV